MGSTLAFTVRRTVNASNSAVWEVLGDFGTEHRWTTALAHCVRDTDEVRVGTVRTCTLPKPMMGRISVREEVTEYEPGAVLAYRLEGSAGPFASATSRWSTSLQPDGTTAVAIEGRFTPRSRAAKWFLWPLAWPMLRRMTRRVIGELEEFVVARSAGSA